MEDRLSAVDSRVDELTALVARLEQRVIALERTAATSVAAAEPLAGHAASGAPASMSRGAAAHQGEPAAAAASTIDLPQERLDLASALALVGRLLIAVGGGFLLRATTEAGTLPPQAGVGVGLLYALLWVAAADRAALRRPWTAVFHSIASALIGFPLLWEATTRFKVLTPAAAAIVLAVLVAAPLVVAWHRRLQKMAWVAVLGACATSLALIAGTGQVVPVALVLIGLGTATLWMGYALDWVGLRWPVAALADLVASALTIRALSPHPLDSAAVTVEIQVLLVAAYLGSIGIRTLVRGRNVVPFEVVQTAAVLLVGVSGAVAVSRAAGSGVGLLGTICLAFGAASYAVAFWFVSQRPHLVRNVYFYTSVALAFVLVGSALLWSEGVLVVMWSALALLACAMWRRTPRFFLVIHGAVYLLAAGIEAGVFGYGLTALASQPTGAWLEPSWRHIVVLGAAIVSSWMAASDGDDGVGSLSHLPRAVIIVTLVWAAGGVIVGGLAPIVAGRGIDGVDIGILATLRTCVLSLSALVVAFIGRHRGFTEWNWLVYPLLIVIGLKMIAQDFSASGPATLFVALALYGVALIVAPRLRRGGNAPVPAG